MVVMVVMAHKIAYLILSKKCQMTIFIYFGQIFFSEKQFKTSIFQSFVIFHATHCILSLISRHMSHISVILTNKIYFELF